MMNPEAFLRSLDHTNTRIRIAINRGMIKAGLRWANDANTEVPTTPLEKGPLRAAYTVHLNGIHSGIVAPGLRSPRAFPLPGNLMGIAPNQVSMQVVLNARYAEYQHRGMRLDGTHVVKNYTTPGSGKNFLEGKMKIHSDDYWNMVAREAAMVIGS
jgi:hypothetical protein